MAVGTSTPAQEQTPSDALLKVVASGELVAAFVREIARDDVRIMVVGAGNADSHHIEPTPADVAAIAGADLVFQLGLGMDPQVAKIHKTSKSKAKLIVLGDGLGDLMIASGHHDHEHEHHEESHQIVDPHVWHDPSKANAMFERVAAALSDARPGLAETFGKRASAIKAQIEELSGWITQEIAKIPAPKRVIVTTHDGLGYFGRRFGVKIIGIEMGGEGIGSVDPAPSQIVKLVDEVRTSGSPVVFADCIHPSLIARTVAREAGVRLVDTLRLDSFAAQGKETSAYLETMRENVRTISKALQQ